MSKGNMFLGLARGSVGDVTFYRRNAQQITRVRVRNVKNPKSPAQMGQRAINHTAVQAYSVLKGICDHSYQGVSYGANSYSKFLSLNMDMLRQKASGGTTSSARAYLPFGMLGVVAMPFILSKGTLPMVDAEYKTDGETAQSNGLLLSSFPASNPQNITYQQVIDALHAQQGDQLTIVRIPSPLSGGYPDEPLAREMLLARIILDPGSHNDPAETQFFDTTGALLRVNDPNPRNEGTAVFRPSGNLMFASVNEFDGSDFGYAVILSRQASDGSWLRSDSVLLYDEQFNENGYTLKQASTLTPTDVIIESDYYLNNAE